MGSQEINMNPATRTKLPRLSALALVVCAAWGLPAWALPQGATVVNGQVSVTQPASGSQVINASNGAIINWKQFSIGAGETTQFIQPSSTSAVLNRVVGPDVSQLLGQLKANGQVFLINPNGIVIGGSARIDTNSFIASTLDLTDADFLAGKLRFFESSGAGRVRNDGVITSAPGGRIVLIAPDIENTGIIQAPDGQILLAAGRKLEIASLDLEGVTFEIQAPTDSVLNLGKLLAENGAVQAFAGSLRHSGEIRAGRMVQGSDGSILLAGSNDLTLTSDSITRTDGASGGSIVLQSAKGTARIAGDISATGAAAMGGSIQVLGQRVAIDAGARLDASGSTGGGRILVGGDFQGNNPEVQNADRVYVGAGAQLTADATAQGDGGRIIVWSEENTRYYGDLSAQGGVLGGNGGFAEVSGKQNLEFAGTAKLGATAGTRGTLLLDPLDLIVSQTSGILTSVVDEFTDFAGNVVTVSPTTLAAVAADVVLQANRHIYIKDAIALTTAGAGITLTAGGATFNAGSIFNTAGISTNAGAVTLRAQAISGTGGITTAGGAVDLLTSGTLNYSGAINAGAGTIQATGTSISGGSYTTTGTVNLTATAGGISVYDLNAGVAHLTATGSINADVIVTDRVNATSTGSSVNISNNGTAALRLGTLSGNSGLYLYSSTGFAQASGGSLGSPFIDFYTDNSLVTAGTVAAPLSIALPSGQTRVGFHDLAAPVHAAFGTTTTVGGLSLEGTVAALGASTVTGSVNLTSLTLGTGTGVLNVSAESTAGFANLLALTVTDGGIHAGTINLQGGGGLYLEASGPVNITSASTSRTSGYGIDVYTRKCVTYPYEVCGDVSPITAGFLNAGTGGIRLRTYDNGDITVTGSLTSGSAYLEAGDTYYVPNPTHSGYTLTQATSNNISLASVTTTGAFSAYNYGQGNIDISGLAAGGSVNVYAGSNYSIAAVNYPYSTSATTQNNISITNLEPALATGNFQVSNSGIGTINLTGAVNRSQSGSVYLSANNGSVAASGDLTARYGIDVTSQTSSVTLANLTATEGQVSASAGADLTVGQVTAGNVNAYDSGVSLNADGNLSFDSITSTANANYSYSGNVNLTSYAGSIKTSNQTNRLDVTATGNVSISANDASNGFIGDSAFANPMDIRAGAAKAVTLSAGRNIGAAGQAVTVDTGGTLDVTSTSGQFHVAATDGAAEKSLSTIRLSASATGIGSGNASTFTSSDLDVMAASDGTTITIGDLVRSTGTLNEFRFAATGASGLTFGDVDLTTTGYNQLYLSATNGLTQTAPGTHNIDAGYISLAGDAGTVTLGNVTSSSVAGNGILIASSGDVNTGNLNGPEVVVSGANLSLGSVTSTGDANRTYYDYYGDYVARLNTYKYSPHKLQLTATESIATSGNIVSATSALLSAGTDVSINEGAGSITAGNKSYYYYGADTAKAWAGTSAEHMLLADTFSGYNVDLKAHTMQVGGLTAVYSLNANGTDVNAGLVSAVYATLAAANALNTDAISATHISLSANAFNTGNLTATGNLTITSTAGYAPSSVALVAGSATINAVGDISLLISDNPSLSASLTAPTVTLNSSEGNISAQLTNTSNLTINTAAGFNVSSNTWLNNLNVTAKWDLATAANSVGASVSSSPTSGSQSFGYSFDGQLYLNAYSSDAAGKSWNLTYHDVSANPVMAGSNSPNDDFVDAYLSHAGSGTFNLSFDSDTVLGDVSATLGTTATSSTAANLVLATGGGVHLSSVQTHGGNVTATSRNADITFGTIDTSAEGFAGDVTLNANNGNIEFVASINTEVTSSGISTGSASGIAIANVAPVSYGTVSLNAANGSVGASGVAIPISYASSLSVNAKDTINISQSNGVLSSLTLTTTGSGNGTLNISDTNFAGLSLARNAGHLTLSGLNPAQLASFSLTALDGSIFLASDISNVNALTLNAGYNLNSTADLVIQAGVEDPRSVSANTYNLRAGRDLLITAGSAAGENVSVTQLGTSSHNYLYAGRDIKVTGDGGSVLVSQAATGWTQYINAGHDLRVTGGSAGTTGASAAITASGHQSISLGNDLLIQAGSADGALAKIEASQSQSGSGINNLSVLGGGNNASASLAGSSQSFSNVYGTVRVEGGSGTSSGARIEATAGSQDIGSYYYSTVDQVLVQGGTGTNATAAIRASSTQNVHSDGDIKVLGGSAAGANAEILSAASSQTIGSSYTYYSIATRDILVQAGSGGTARIKAGGSQNIQGGGIISVLGGTTAGMSASIETTGSQTIGTSSNYTYDPTGNILVQGGTGADAFASVKASGAQTINTGGTLSVLGNSGVGSYAEILTTGGSQTIGSNSTSSNDATDAILVQAGSASGSAASIKAATGQTINTGGTITLTGGAANAFAEMSTTAGTQTIGNVDNSYYIDPTDSITLTGGSVAGSYARIGTGGTQNVRSAADITLLGGVGSNSGAQLLAGTGQNLTAYGKLSMTGGNGTGTGVQATAIRNSLSGNQTLNVTGDITVTGGSGLADTWIYQAGSGAQTISAGGNLTLISPSATPNVNVTSMEAFGSAQNITVGGSLTVDNQAGWITYIAASGTQSINADSLAVSLSSTSGANPFAGLSASGNQAITLRGDEATAGTATLSVTNSSNTTGSTAAITSGGNQTILMNYDAAGLVRIGDVSGQGLAKISAAGDLTLVAGQVLLQGGATAGSDAKLLAGAQPPSAPTATMLISSLYGPVELKGGVAGGAYIDPAQLDVVSNGSVQMLAGATSSANTNITADLFNLAATIGNLSLVNSTTSSATASITSGTFNFVGPGAVTLLGGTITATAPSTISVTGLCTNCDTNLLSADLFTVQAYVPPLAVLGVSVVPDILAMTDLTLDMFELVFDEDGNLVLTKRRLNQCY
jgi:filamentous hemagglutinin family protein